MNFDPEEFDEDMPDPFEMLGFLGLGVTDEEDDDDEEEDDDFGDRWDDDVYWADVTLIEWALGDWGHFPEGITWDGSRDLSDEPAAEDLSPFDHICLVMAMRSEERRNARSS